MSALLSEVPVRKNLPIRLRTVLIEPADHADEFFLQSIAPQRKLILLDGMYTHFGGIATVHPLWPRVAYKAVRQQAELRGLFHTDTDRRGLRSVTGFRQCDAILSIR